MAGGEFSASLLPLDGAGWRSSISFRCLSCSQARSWPWGRKSKASPPPDEARPRSAELSCCWPSCCLRPLLRSRWDLSLPATMRARRFLHCSLLILQPGSPRLHQRSRPHHERRTPPSCWLRIRSSDLINRSGVSPVRGKCGGGEYRMRETLSSPSRAMQGRSWGHRGRQRHCLARVSRMRK